MLETLVEKLQLQAGVINGMQDRVSASQHSTTQHSTRCAASPACPLHNQADKPS